MLKRSRQLLHGRSTTEKRRISALGRRGGGEGKKDRNKVKGKKEERKEGTRDLSCKHSGILLVCTILVGPEYERA